MDKNIDEAFINFYKEKLEEKHPEFKKYEQISEIINNCKHGTKYTAEFIVFLIFTILLFSLFILTGSFFDIFHLNLIDIGHSSLLFVSYFLFICLFGFMSYPEAYSFIQFLLHIQEKPTKISYRAFYYSVFRGFDYYIDKISSKTIINSDAFYNIIKESHYSIEEKNKMIRVYSKLNLHPEISLMYFSELVSRITTKDRYGYRISNFYKK